VLSDLDTDAFGILCRNLIENALSYSQAGTPVSILLDAEGRLTVTNEGLVHTGGSVGTANVTL
jgi:two-component system OmpR family sensor kinase